MGHGSLGQGTHGPGEAMGTGGRWARGTFWTGGLMGQGDYGPGGHMGQGGLRAKGACRPEGDGDGWTYLRTDVLSTPYGEEVSVPSQGRCLKGNRSQVVSTRERVLMKKRKGIGAR